MSTIAFLAVVGVLVFSAVLAIVVPRIRSRRFVEEVISFARTARILRANSPNEVRGDCLRLRLLRHAVEGGYFVTQVILDFELIPESVLQDEWKRLVRPEFPADSREETSEFTLVDVIVERKYCYTFLSWDRRKDWKEDFMDFCRFWYADIATIKREDQLHQEFLAHVLRGRERSL